MTEKSTLTNRQDPPRVCPGTTRLESAMSLVNSPTQSSRLGVLSAGNERAQLHDTLHRVGSGDAFEVTHAAAPHVAGVSEGGHVLGADLHAVDRAATTTAVLAGVHQALSDAHDALAPLR